MFDWVLFGPINAMLALAAVIAARMGRRLQHRRLSLTRPRESGPVGRHRVGVAPGTSALRAAAAAAAAAQVGVRPMSPQVELWSISAQARRAGRLPRRPALRLIRPPVWAGAAS
jgi:hypothetical protein